VESAFNSNLHLFLLFLVLDLVVSFLRRAEQSIFNLLFLLKRSSLP